jgi:hypothetical protein
MSLTETAVPTFTAMLTALAGWLDKAEAQAGAGDAMMGWRLAPDMFPLAAQIRFAAFQPREGIARLAGTALPADAVAIRDEALAANEHPGTLAEARSHLAGTLGLLGTVGPGALDLAADQPLALELPNGMAFDMTGAQYLRDWLLPQFYFHVMTTYAILRHHGVPLGKADYVPHMFAYLRR